MSVQNDFLLSNLDFLPTFELTAVDLSAFDVAQLGNIEPDIDQPARRGQDQPNTDFSDSETCSAAERRVQSRLSECSSTYARQVCSLLRDFSICGSDDEDPELHGMHAHPFLEEDTDRDE